MQKPGDTPNGQQTGAYFPAVGDYILVKDSLWDERSPSNLRPKFYDRGLVLAVEQRTDGPRVEYLSSVNGAKHFAIASQVVPDKWGAVRAGGSALKKIFAEQHIVVQFLLGGLMVAASIRLLTGIIIAANSSPYYRFVGAAWSATKFGILGGIAVLVVFVVAWSIFDAVIAFLTRRPKTDANSDSASAAWAPWVIGILVASIAGYGAWMGWKYATIHTSIGEIEADRNYFHGNGVQVDGAISNYKQHVSRLGNRYVTATVCEDDQSCVRIFEWGDADPSAASADWVDVWGTYRAENRVDGYVYNNEIDANDVKSTAAPWEQNP
jgi:hypothetical protein